MRGSHWLGGEMQGLLKLAAFGSLEAKGATRDGWACSHGWKRHSGRRMGGVGGH